MGSVTLDKLIKVWGMCKGERSAEVKGQCVNVVSIYGAFWNGTSNSTRSTPQESGCTGALCDTQLRLCCVVESIDPEHTNSDLSSRFQIAAREMRSGATPWMDAGLAQGHHIWISTLKVNREPTASSLAGLPSASDL